MGNNAKAGQYQAKARPLALHRLCRLPLAIFSLQTLLLLFLYNLQKIDLQTAMALEAVFLVPFWPGLPQLLRPREELAPRPGQGGHAGKREPDLEKLLLQEKQNEFTKIAAAIGDGISIQDRQLKIIYQNEAHKKLIGEHAGEFCFRAYEKREHVCEGCPVVKSFTDGNTHTLERRVLTPEGVRHVEITASPLKDAAGRIIAGIEVVRDITGRKEAEESLRQISDALRAVFQASPSAIMALDPAGNVTMWNAAAERTFGWAEEEVLGRFNPIIPEEKVEEFHKFAGRVMAGEHLNNIEARRKNKKGQDVLISLDAAPLYDAAGQPAGIMAFCTDITLHKILEEQLFQSSRDWQEAFDTITDIITVHDADFNIIRANKAARESLALPKLIPAGTRCFRHYHGSQAPPHFCASCETAQTGKPASFEIFEPHLQKYIEVRAIPRFDINQKLVGSIHVVRDISDRKRAEEQVQTSLERLCALRAIDAAITASMDLRFTLGVVLEQTVRQLGCDAAAVFLFNPAVQELELAAGRGLASIKVDAVPSDQGAAGQALRERKTLIVSDPGAAAAGQSRLLLAEGFQSLVVTPIIAKGQAKGVLEIFYRSRSRPDQEWLDFLEILAGQTAIAVDNATLLEKLHRSNEHLVRAYNTTIEGWSRALDMRDRETEGHSRRVTELTLQVAKKMGLDGEELIHIRRGALLHDIGKLGVPDRILLKPGPLTEEEWEVMKKHPEIAYDLLSPIPYLRPSLDIPYCHHEKWDGTGYPRGLKGDQIPLAARIFAIIDVWDALRSDRPYRSAWPREDVLELLRASTGTHFDPEVAAIFLQMIDKETAEQCQE